MIREDAANTVAVIGAGPFGLSIAAALKAVGAPVSLFGGIMSFWKEHVPKGMTLLSGPNGVSFCRDQFSMSAYEKCLPAPLGLPISLEDFVAYGHWYHDNACPKANTRHVANLSRAASQFKLVLDDASEITASRVVIAVGMKPFAFRPPEILSLPAEIASHTSEISDLTRFRDKEVVVIGSGQSALECAALLAEQNARVEVIARGRQLPWRKTGHLEWSSRPTPTGLAALHDLPRAMLRRLLDDPDFFRRLPAALRAYLLQRTLRTAISGELKTRLGAVRINLGQKVLAASLQNGWVELHLDDGSLHKAEHVILGTGFKVDIRRLSFLAPELRSHIRQHDGYPELDAAMQCSIRGLYFAGAAAAGTFGPIMWFVRSAPWCAKRIQRSCAPTRLQS